MIEKVLFSVTSPQLDFDEYPNTYVIQFRRTYLSVSLLNGMYTYMHLDVAIDSCKVQRWMEVVLRYDSVSREVFL